MMIKSMFVVITITTAVMGETDVTMTNILIMTTIIIIITIIIITIIPIIMMTMI